MLDRHIEQRERAVDPQEVLRVSTQHEVFCLNVMNKVAYAQRKGLDYDLLKKIKSDDTYICPSLVHLPGSCSPFKPLLLSFAHLKLDVDLDLARRLVSSFTVGSILDQGCQQGPCPILHSYDWTLSHKFFLGTQGRGPWID